MNKIPVVLLILFLMGLHSSAQYFERIYPGLNMSSVGSLDNTIDSGFIICGTQDGGFLLKVNENGDTEWTSRDSGNVQQSAAVIQSVNGNFIVIGSCASQQYNSEAIEAFYDASGDPITYVKIPPPDGWGSSGTGIVRSPDRALSHYCYYVDGFTSDNAYFLDTHDQIAGDMTDIGLNSISVDNMGNYYTAGNLAFDMDSLFIWHNNVSVLSSNHFPRSEYFFDTDISSATITADGGFLLAGLYDSLGIKYLRIMKFDMSANLQWENYIDDSDLYSVNQVAQTSDGGFAILCAADTGVNMHITFTKTDASGMQLWKQEFFGNGTSVPKNFVKLDDGFAILGSSQGDPYLLRTDSLGRTFSTGISAPESADSPIRIYPNPTSGFISLSFQEYTDGLLFNIFDLTGRNVFTAAIREKEKHYDLSMLSRGVYLYKIEFHGGMLKCGKLAVD